MCGIAGILNMQPAEPPHEGALRQMLAMIRHRGPDQFGIYLDEQVGLGSARLSIVDLGGGQQPISNADGNLWIVFNGEVFNHVELRAELETRGHRFTTHTDTEVVLHLFEEAGPACLARLNGQFAFAIWDRRRRSLFMARDRLGVRPLFYTQAGGALIFGSEIKAILADDRVRAEIDPVALDQIFTYWSTLSPRTCFRGIQELPPGHFLTARDGQINVESYWRPEFPTSPPRTEADYLAELRTLLVDAVKIRLRADVPVGAYLSGGLDSSLIAAIIRKVTANKLDTFSISFSDPQFDESGFQQQMAKFLGTEHQVVHATHADIGQVFPEVIWHTETPVLRTSPAPMFLLSRLVRDRRYKVVLTGEGADEFLGGYDIFKEAKVRRFWARQPASAWRSRLLQKLYPDIAGLAGSGSALLAAFFRQGLTEVESPDYSHAIRWRNTRRICRFFSDELTDAIRRDPTGGTAVYYPPEFSQWGPLERSQYLEISIFLSQYLLSSQGDRMGMAHSVEGRFPFLDFRMVEFCNRLPARMKLRGLQEKYLLKQLGREWLPAEIWRRRKRPYRAPIRRSFFEGTPAAYVREILEPAAIRTAGLFNPDRVSQLVAKTDQNRPMSETDEMALVGIISSQLVHHQFVDRLRKSPPLGAGDDVKVVDQTTGRRPPRSKGRHPVP
ncbi:MAG: asparagine synthase (glutamine-hydrolyzing) [Verrucomicrobiota bacterium]